LQPLSFTSLFSLLVAQPFLLFDIRANLITGLVLLHSSPLFILWGFRGGEFIDAGFQRCGCGLSD
jgi:hypothetical protein